MRPIRNPDSTKNRNTPWCDEYSQNSTRSPMFGSNAKRVCSKFASSTTNALLPAACTQKTRSTATPRSPSSAA
jgi:hypothetical protein